MSKLTFSDKLLIRATASREYLFNDDHSASNLRKRTSFYTQYVDFVNKKYKWKLSVEKVRARWRKLRDIFGTADLLHSQKKSLTKNLESVFQECSFLKGYVTHKQRSSSAPTPECRPDPVPENEESLDNEQEEDAAENGEEMNVGNSDMDRIDIDEEDNPLQSAIENNEAFKNLIDEVNRQVPCSKGKRQRCSRENINLDFPKKMPKDTHEDDQLLQTLLAKITELSEKSDMLLKAKARALLVCSYIDPMPPNQRIRCTQRILDIIKKYQ